MSHELSGLIEGWPQYLSATLLVMVRLSGLMVFAPVFSSPAISPRVKAGLVFAMTVLLAPVVASVPGARSVLDTRAVLGELGVGLVFGLSLTLLNEALEFAGTLLGLQFSFSLVNLLDPNSMIETAVLGQMLGWLGILVIIGSGLDRSLLAAVVRSFSTVPVGQAVMQAKTGVALAGMAGGAGGGGDDCVSCAIISAIAGDGSQHSAKDAGVIRGFDREPGGLARVDRTALYRPARYCGTTDGAGLSTARQRTMRRLQIIWSSRLDGSLLMVWAEEGLETRPADVSFLSARSFWKGGCSGR
jgi:flagellar biosynthesis protein FliR